MGLTLSSLLSKVWDVFQEKPAKVLLIGLDAAGKTTLLYKVKLNLNATTVPTIGFNVEEVEPVKGLKLTVFDVGGQDKIRKLWHHYTQDMDGLIWMVDSADSERFDESKDELNKILDCHGLVDCPILVFANKQDLPGAKDPSTLGSAIGLYDNNNSKMGGGKRETYVQASNCISGEGVYEGFEYLAQMIRRYRTKKAENGW